jgi:2-oxoisovalerate dehydrogenase E2 component (dihydrolipoyl transacylase)
MGVRVIKMPDIGEGIAEVELVAWHVKPGDAVVEDQPLADVMTDKASVEIPSPGGRHGAGARRRGRADDGGRLGADPDRDRGGRRRARSGARRLAGPAPGRRRRAAPAKPVTAPAKPVAAAPAKAAVAAHTPDAPASPAERPRASPSVRRRASELELDLRALSGTGARRQDRPRRPRGRGRRGERADAGAYRRRGGARGRDRAIPVIGMRRRIAQKMQEAKRRIPHFSYVEEVDVTELEELRARLNAKWGEARPKLTLLPVPAARRGARRARVPAGQRPLRRRRGRRPSSPRGARRHRHPDRRRPDGAGAAHAEALDLWASATEISRIAAGARCGKMSRDELTGSTITITSLGALGGIATTPVINHPEVAIVGVNRIVERPMFRSGAVVPRLLMNLSSSFDHRIVDGMDAARFVQALRGYLEAPATLFID